MESEVQSILIIDDEPVVCGVLRTLLSLKYQCSTVSDATEALRQIHTKSYDLVLADLGLPDATGWELCGRVKAVSPHTEVVLISGNIQEGIAEESVRRGAFGFIQKPFNLSSIERLVEQALAHRGSAVA